MNNDHFSNIWGDKETRLSAIIAQTLLLSEKFREFFNNKIGLHQKAYEIDYINTEENFGEGQIDIFIRTTEEILIAIENKKWADFQPNQLKRYDDYLKKVIKDSSKYKLIFLAPSSYPLSEDLKPDNLITINYKEIIDWINEQNNVFDNVFETIYFENLKTYIGVLEMSEINQEEIDSLKYVAKFTSIKNKVKKIMSEIKETKLGFEDNSSGYYLSGVHYNLLFAGMRYGNGWYFKEDFNENEPEFIVYIKDDWNDDIEKINNQKIKSIYENINNNTLQGDILKFYPHKKKVITRLVVKRKIADFQDKDISEVSTWFKKYIELFESSLKENGLIDAVVS